MATFGNKKDQGGRGRTRTTARPASEDKDKKKDSYKAKRSFTKNKTYRETNPRDEKSGPKRPYREGAGKRDERGPARENKFGKKEGGFEKSRAPFSRDRNDRAERPDRKSSGSEERSARPARRAEGGERPFERRSSGPKREGENRFERKEGGERPFERRSSAPKRDGDNRFEKKEGRRSEGGDRPFERRSSAPKRDGDSRFEKKEGRRSEGGERPFERRSSAPKRDGDSRFEKRESRSDDRSDRPERKGSFEKGLERRVKHDELEEGRAFKKQEVKEGAKAPKAKEDGLTRLNKYLANAGISSRREADTLIQSGVVKVNGEVVDQLGYKVKAGDKVTYGDSAVKSERKVYLLLNKPKDYISTVDDPRERKTVMDLIVGACKERVYPVGRLDRNTTGLLLMTNDGDLTKKLTHPKFGVKKIYHVTLNKGLKVEDFRQITEGMELEDGPIKVDDLAFVGEGKKEVGVEIHSGRNRIVRRMFEQLGYDVVKLDRVVFAGLTKKDLPRGKHRFLTAKEISFLQMLG
jgi:23S rRNA pseudouridine2605 synthase